MKISKVTVVGNIGIDTNIYGAEFPTKTHAQGQFTENRDYVGQAGGYTSRGYARLGYDTAFIGSVGDDWAGQAIRHTLTQDGIDTRGLFIDPAGTCRSVNLMAPDGTRRNFYDGKSHMNLQPDPDLCQEVLSDCRLAHFHIPNWARHILPRVDKNRTVIACDLQDVTSIDAPYTRDFIVHSNIIFFSDVHLNSPGALMETVLDEFPEKILVAGMGARGCALATRQGIRFFDPVEMKQPVIDTNGAGDGLAVGFLSAFVLERRSLEEAVLWGQIAARHTCSLKAETDHLISRHELQRWAKEMQ